MQRKKKVRGERQPERRRAGDLSDTGRGYIERRPRRLTRETMWL